MRHALLTALVASVALYAMPGFAAKKKTSSSKSSDKSSDEAESTGMWGLGASVGAILLPLPWPSEFGSAGGAEFSGMQSDHVWQLGGKYVVYMDNSTRVGGVARFSTGGHVRGGEGCAEYMYTLVKDKFHWMAGGQAGISYATFAEELTVFSAGGRLQATALYHPKNNVGVELSVFYGLLYPFSQKVEETSYEGGNYTFGGLELAVMTGSFKQSSNKKKKSKKSKKGKSSDKKSSGGKSSK